MSSATSTFFAGAAANIGAVLASPFKKFAALSTSRKWAVLVSVCAFILATGDRVKEIPGIPATVAQFWPYLMILAGMIVKLEKVNDNTTPTVEQVATALTTPQGQQALAKFHVSPQGQAILQTAIAAAQSPKP